MRKRLAAKFVHGWEHSAPILEILRPIAWGYRLVIALRKNWYRFFKPKPFNIPIFIVGNITVGGNGKTPIVIALALALKAKGYETAIISRGYKGSLGKKPTLVKWAHTAQEVGDEPLLIHQKTQLPVVIGRNRKKAAEKILELFPATQVILSDDGLQHYALARFKEICVISTKTLGNGYLLPAGPLREPMRRLKQVDYVLSDNTQAIEGFSIQWAQQGAYRLGDSSQIAPLSYFKGTKVHAVTGIACPHRFYRMLQLHGIFATAHSFPDHHFFQSKDLFFQDNFPILITEKDAVKCRGLKIRSPVWVVSLEVTLEEAFISHIIEDIENGQKVA